MKTTPSIATRRQSLPSLLLAAACFAMTALGAEASPPEKMTYQGFLVDASGNALGVPNPKNYDVVFRIYDEQNGGNDLWAEQQTVTVDKGYFSVLLGEGSAVPGSPRPPLPTVFAGASVSERYVAITVKLTASSSVDITPRLKLVTSPFAFLAKNATALVNESGQPIVSAAGSALQVNGTVTATNLSGFGTIPIGGIIMWSGSVENLPAGWALCDGQAVNGRPTPDLRGRFVLGSGTGLNLSLRIPHQSGGEETHKLTVSEMPRHRHRIGFGGAGGDDWGGGTYEVNWGTGWNDGEIEDTGGDQPHNTMPPFYVLAFIMRVQ